MPTSVRLDPAVEEQLEDAYLGAAVLERIRAGKEKTYSLDEVKAELGLDTSDL